MNAIQKKWSELPRRDRSMLLGGGITVLLIIGYNFIWEPWHTGIDKLSAQVPAKRQTLQWINRQVEIAKGLDRRTRANDSSSIPLLKIVEDSAKQARLRDMIRQMTPGEEAGEVKLWLSDVSFDDWLKWIDSIGKRHQVEVVDASVQPGKENKVNIRATLTR